MAIKGKYNRNRGRLFVIEMVNGRYKSPKLIEAKNMAIDCILLVVICDN